MSERRTIDLRVTPGAAGAARDAEGDDSKMGTAPTSGPEATSSQGNDPKCDKCGAEITTAMMAVFCPLREHCEFWPRDGESDHFLRWMRGEVEEPWPKTD